MISGAKAGYLALRRSTTAAARRDARRCRRTAQQWLRSFLYHEKKVLQLHTCWSFRITNFLCLAEKTCNAKIIRENRKETRLRSISCMRKVVCVAALATQCVTVTLFSCDILAGFRCFPRLAAPRTCRWRPCS